MVEFHDRRRARVDSVQDITPGLDLQPGDTLSKSVIDGRYIVRGSKTEEGRRYSVHEVRPDGQIVERASDLPSRRDARKTAKRISPTQTYDIT